MKRRMAVRTECQSLLQAKVREGRGKVEEESVIEKEDTDLSVEACSMRGQGGGEG